MSRPVNLGLVALGLLLAGCQRAPQRVFAVEIAPATAAAAPTQAAPSGALVLTPRHHQLDLNHAAAAELQALPGMDTATLHALIAGRPYASKRELLTRAVFTDAQYTRWEPYLVVRRANAIR